MELGAGELVLGKHFFQVVLALLLVQELEDWSDQGQAPLLVQELEDWSDQG